MYIVDCVIDHSSSRSSISAIIANEHRPLGYHHRRAGWLSPSSHDTNICVRRSRIGVRDWVSSGEEAAETFNDRYLSAALDYVAAVNFASTPTRTGRQLSLPGVVRRQPHCEFTCTCTADSRDRSPHDQVSQRTVPISNSDINLVLLLLVQRPN